MSTHNICFHGEIERTVILGYPLLWIHAVALISVVNRFDYVFAENGLVAFKDGVQIGQQVCTM